MQEDKTQSKTMLPQQNTKKEMDNKALQQGKQVEITLRVQGTSQMKQQVVENHTVIKEQGKGNIENQVNEVVVNIEDEQGENEQQDNQSNWTDATKSISPDDQDDIWVVDDDIINAMDQDSVSEEDEEYDYEESVGQNGEKKEKKEGQEGQKQKGKKKDQMDLKDLEQQFIQGRQSNQDWRLGKHETFCTSVSVSKDGKTVVTGGGDDLMLCFRQQQNQEWKEFYRLKHTETVNKVQISFDNKYVVSYTENEIYCTELLTQQTRKLQIEEPTDLVSHKQGGVIAVSNPYTVSIFNIKGLDLFTSYNLDTTPHLISFCDKGKQIVAACDNKIRIITPKNGEIFKGNGGDFHKEEISAMAIGNNIVYTGCIEGKVYASNLNKGTTIGSIDEIKTAINLLALTQNNQYLLIAPQGDGLHWIDASKMKKIFHSPRDISVSDIVQVQSSTLMAIADLQGNIYIMDRRNPKDIIRQYQAGNTIHKLFSRGNQIYAACEDGYVRIFNLKDI